MTDLQEKITMIVKAVPTKLILSKPKEKTAEYKKIVIEKKRAYFQAAQYTEKQVFHLNLQQEELADFIEEQLENRFSQLNAWDEEKEYMLLRSKKGKLTCKSKKIRQENLKKERSEEHNRKKNYLLEEGKQIPPLIDMGVFTKDGKIVRTMYDKYRQINRFLEIVEDGVKEYGKDEIHIIDFGCGKSYLTFILYYYFTEIKQIKTKIIGLDLKEDVIEKCNRTAEKYGYENLRFELGDINGYQAPFEVDMVVTLHACDTATDFALYNAIQWNAKMIFSVPCCQHEINRQMKTEELAIFTRYGIIQERMAALMTDAVRGNLLEYCGYKTQILEFIDYEQTPKNLLIRAVRKPVVPLSVKKKYLSEVRAVMEEFQAEPTLYRLLEEEGRIPKQQEEQQNEVRQESEGNNRTI